jgi:hypothetical protein
MDVDLDSSEIQVNGTFVTSKGLPDGYVRKPPKSPNSQRLLALDSPTVQLLTEHRTRCEAMTRDLELPLSPAGYVFARTLDGRHPVRPDAMTRRFTELASRLGHRFTLYSLRRFMATQLGAVAATGTVRGRMGARQPGHDQHLHAPGYRSRPRRSGAHGRTGRPGRQGRRPHATGPDGEEPVTSNAHPPDPSASAQRHAVTAGAVPAAQVGSQVQRDHQASI